MLTGLTRRFSSKEHYLIDVKHLNKKTVFHLAKGRRITAVGRSPEWPLLVAGDASENAGLCGRLQPALRGGQRNSALRTLPEVDVDLVLDDFRDGPGNDTLGATIEVFVERTDFTNDERLMAHWCDCVVEPEPGMAARLICRFQPQARFDGDPRSLADHGHVIFGAR